MTSTVRAQARRDRGVSAWMAGNVAGASITVVGIALGLAGGHTPHVVGTGLAVLYGSLIGLIITTTLDRRARKSGPAGLAKS